MMKSLLINVGKMSMLALLGVLTSCGDGSDQRELQFFPEMYQNPALKPQEPYNFFDKGLSSLVPPEGTIPVGYTPYPYTIIEGELAGAELENPLPKTAEVLEVGRKYFDIHCIICHGPVGSGDGLASMAKRPNGMPVPPQLYSEKIRNDWKDGQIYHTITLGQGQMSGYGSRIDPSHRWAIVHYIRALGVAANPSEEDLQAVEKLGWDAQSMDSPLLERDPGVMKKKKSVFQLDPENAVKERME
jgi:mono/diheme cytochrome c family protein